MEPATIITTALVLGAATGVGSIAEQAVKDVYQSLKSLIRTRYPAVVIDRLEQKPDSERRQGVIEEDLADTDADQDTEILVKAKTILEAVQRLPVQSVPAVGIDLERIKAAALTLEDIVATGTGVSARLALHYSRGEIRVNEAMVIESIIGTRFTGRVVETVHQGSFEAVIPEVEGTAYIIARNEFYIDPQDPLKNGFILR